MPLLSPASPADKLTDSTKPQYVQIKDLPSESEDGLAPLRRALRHAMRARRPVAEVWLKHADGRLLLLDPGAAGRSAASSGAALTFSGGSFTVLASAVSSGPGFVGVPSGSPSFSGFHGAKRR